MCIKIFFLITTLGTNRHFWPNNKDIRWNFSSNWLFLNTLKSWDSFEKNGCFESETTFKMNLIKWADFSGPRKAWGGLPGKLCCPEQSGPASPNRRMWFKSESSWTTLICHTELFFHFFFVFQSFYKRSFLNSIF